MEGKQSSLYKMRTTVAKRCNFDLRRMPQIIEIKEHIAKITQLPNSKDQTLINRLPAVKFERKLDKYDLFPLLILIDNFIIRKRSAN
uniref:Uncharacterized protein n=1 Tax=Onchocerca volvulus TaxID=6282 RepID=A0A8R1Y0T1_ONCVO